MEVRKHSKYASWMRSRSLFFKFTDRIGWAYDRDDRDIVTIAFLLDQAREWMLAVGYGLTMSSSILHGLIELTTNIAVHKETRSASLHNYMLRSAPD